MVTRSLVIVIIININFCHGSPVLQEVVVSLTGIVDEGEEGLIVEATVDGIQVSILPSMEDSMQLLKLTGPAEPMHFVERCVPGSEKQTLWPQHSQGGHDQTQLLSREQGDALETGLPGQHELGQL